MPSRERLLKVLPGKTVLDVACGNGVFSRRLAELGARVVAIDFSEKFVELAMARTEEAGYGDAVEYLVADATDEEQMLALREERFDAAVCNMALMDMPAIDPLMRVLRRFSSRKAASSSRCSTRPSTPTRSGWHWRKRTGTVSW
jgi:ubiquinone/menaquinone biosynthesis C-methylase UbiE